MRKISTALAATVLGLVTVVGLSTAAQGASTSRAVVDAQAAASGDSVGANVKLMVRYATVSTCRVYLNYPKNGVVGNRTFDIPAGRSVIWRYNVNATWAMVSDPSRATHRTWPWWGLSRRSCIGNSIPQQDYPAGVPVPSRILEGRSNVAPDGWRQVYFNERNAPLVRRMRMQRNGTLRDRANFVNGNVPAGWTVDVTNVSRSDGHWRLVYVPNAKRWGYVEARKLA